MEDKETGESSASNKDVDKDVIAPRLSNDDFVLPLLIFTIFYDVLFSLSAILLNSMTPQLWTPSPIMAKTVTFFTLLLNAHIDLELLTSHSPQLPIAIYVLPLLICVGMNILLLSLLQPYETDTIQQTPTSWILTVCTISTLGSGLAIGLSVLEDLLIVMPLTMSFFVLPWYFAFRRKRVLGADVDSLAKR